LPSRVHVGELESNHVDPEVTEANRERLHWRRIHRHPIAVREYQHVLAITRSGPEQRWAHTVW
jgi:hypothetical protein